MKIPQAQRERIKERSRGHCEWCGKLPDFRGLSDHHIEATKMGGTKKEYKDEEIIRLCGICHYDKPEVLRQIKRLFRAGELWESIRMWHLGILLTKVQERYVYSMNPVGKKIAKGE